MRTIPILALLLAATVLVAEDRRPDSTLRMMSPEEMAANPSRILDPRNAADAVLIIDYLSQKLTLDRQSAEFFRTALITLAQHVAAHPPATATATPPPAAAPKKD